MLLLAFDGAAPSPALRQRQEAALAAAQAAADTPGSPLYRGFPSPLWWLAQNLAPGVVPGVGVTAEVRVERTMGVGWVAYCWRWCGRPGTARAAGAAAAAATAAAHVVCRVYGGGKAVTYRRACSGRSVHGQ